MGEPRKKQEALYLDLIGEIDNLLKRIEKIKKSTPVDRNTFIRFVLVTIISNIIIAGSVYYLLSKSDDDKQFIEAGKLFNERLIKLPKHKQQEVLRILSE